MKIFLVLGRFFFVLFLDFLVFLFKLINFGLKVYYFVFVGIDVLICLPLQDMS